MFQQPNGNAPLAPLRGRRVLDLSRYLPGPWLTRVLCDLGAEVIKIEPPGGEGLRFLPPLKDGVGCAYMALNAGKQVIEVNLKKDIQSVLDLVDTADVLVESYRPGKLAKLGLSNEVLWARNPKLVICSVSGYGKHSQRAGHDLNYVARAGVLGQFGPKDGPPQVPGVQLADIGGALTGVIGVLAALMEGGGRHLDISIARSTLPFAVMALAGDAGVRGRAMFTGGAAGCQVYETKDGGFMALAALEPHFFRRFCELADVPPCDPYSEAGMPVLEAAFKSRTRDEWVTLLQGEDVCCEPVLSRDEALADEEVGADWQTWRGFNVLRANLGAPLPELEP
jgi:alpha-methylacyl-CoA racemase